MGSNNDLTKNDQEISMAELSPLVEQVPIRENNNNEIICKDSKVIIRHASSLDIAKKKRNSAQGSVFTNRKTCIIAVVVIFVLVFACVGVGYYFIKIKNSKETSDYVKNFYDYETSTQMSEIKSGDSMTITDTNFEESDSITTFLVDGFLYNEGIPMSQTVKNDIPKQLPPVYFPVQILPPADIPAQIPSTDISAQITPADISAQIPLEDIPVQTPANIPISTTLQTTRADSRKQTSRLTTRSGLYKTNPQLESRKLTPTTGAFMRKTTKRIDTRKQTSTARSDLRKPTLRPITQVSTRKPTPRQMHLTDNRRQTPRSSTRTDMKTTPYRTTRTIKQGLK